MEYLVLARKWRPQVFADVLGQEAVVRTLSNAITQERIAHAFLFSGPRGVGKTSIARILAKALNCEQGPRPVPCGQCSHCTEITNGNAIDVREIDGASNRGIDEIRELRENVKFAPVSCRFKIYIIDEVHMLTREAFNALLKTLEEPPAHVIFIFATTETNKVPATILSRCQCFEFRRIPLKLIAESLKKIAQAEGIQISDAALAWIAEAGDGSLRDSQSIFDQVISYAGFAIEDKAVEEILGRSDRRFLFLLSEAVLGRDAGRCLKVIDEAYYAGLDMKFFYQSLLAHFRNLLFVGIPGAEEALADLPADEREKLKKLVAGAPRESLLRFLEILMSEEEALRRSQNPRLNLETVLCRMAYLEPLLPIEAVLARMEGLEKRLAGSTAPPSREPEGQGGRTNGDSRMGGGISASGAAERTPAGVGRAASQVDARRPAAGGNVSVVPSTVASPAAGVPAKVERVAESHQVYADSGAATPEGRWNEFKNFLKRQDAALSAKIESGRCLEWQEGRLRIGFVMGYLFRDDVDAGKAAIEKLAGQFCGRETDLTIETLAPEAVGANGSGNGNGLAERAARNQRLQEIRREALSSPLLMKILDVFPRAEVRDVRLREVPVASALPPQEELPPLPEDESELPPEALNDD